MPDWLRSHRILVYQNSRILGNFVVQITQPALYCGAQIPQWAGVATQNDSFALTRLAGTRICFCGDFCLGDRLDDASVAVRSAREWRAS
jgi:hypothetical protein